MADLLAAGGTLVFFGSIVGLVHLFGRVVDPGDAETPGSWSPRAGSAAARPAKSKEPVG
ncbi:MAG: hypothetical protein ACYDH5_08550 [Acidimicrobiales bacterium]